MQVDHGSADLDDDGGLGVPAWCTVTVVCWRPASFVVASMVCGRTNPSSSPHRTGRAGSAAPNDGDQPAMIIVGRRNITDAPGGSRGRRRLPVTIAVGLIVLVGPALLV